MGKPWEHAESSAKQFGGKPEDYIDIHDLLDSSKSVVADSRHRALTHNTWFIGPNGPLERIFGKTILNSDNKNVSVRDIAEQHIREDFNLTFIPSAQDYLQNMRWAPWMDGMLQFGSCPESFVDKQKFYPSVIYRPYGSD